MRYSIFENRVNSLIRFFLCLIIFWLPYSPAVVESSVVAGLLLWILKRGMIFYRGRGNWTAFRLPNTPLNIPIIVFSIICIFSSLSSPFWEESLPNFLTKTLEWFIVYFLVIEGVTERKHIYLIFGVFTVTFLATVLDSLVQYYLTYKDVFLGRMIEPGARATAGFKAPNGLGAYLTGVIPIVFAWIFKKNEGLRYRLLLALLFFLAIWSLAVTFSREAWSTVFLGIMFFVLLLVFPKRPRRLFFVFGILLISLALCALLGFILTSDRNDPSFRYDTIFWRLHIWKDTFRMIEDSPVFGHGINTFMQMFEAYRTDAGGSPTYAHNSYLQLMAETGIIGLVSFLWILGSLFRWLSSHVSRYGIKSDDLILPALGVWAGIVAFLLQSFFDNQFYSLQLSVYLWFLIGFLAAITKEIKWQSANER